MHTNKQTRFVWGFMLENTYFTEFDEVNHRIIEDAYNQRKKKPASYYITITDTHLSSIARIYFGVAQVHLRMPGTRYYVKRKSVRQSPSPPPIDLAVFNDLVFQKQCYGLNCCCLYIPGCCGLIQLPTSFESNTIPNSHTQNTNIISNTLTHTSDAESTSYDKDIVKKSTPCKYSASSPNDANFTDGYSLSEDSTMSDSASINTYISSSVDSNCLIDVNLLDSNRANSSIESSLLNNNLDSNLLDGNFLNTSSFDMNSFGNNALVVDPFIDPNFNNKVLASNLTTWNAVVPSQDFSNLAYQTFQT
ncbi:hypothetical protein K501DRAFT_314497 [Backusella circina FSU 941]|nr:hypothetical protein K501DRAFT_314497 [Backusella circina FSU 941]